MGQSGASSDSPLPSLKKLCMEVHTDWSTTWPAPRSCPASTKPESSSLLREGTQLGGDMCQTLCSTPCPTSQDTAGRHSQIARSCRSSRSWRSRRPPGWGWPAAVAAPAHPKEGPRGVVKARQRGRGRAMSAAWKGGASGPPCQPRPGLHVTQEQSSHLNARCLDWFELSSLG